MESFPYKPQINRSHLRFIIFLFLTLLCLSAKSQNILGFRLDDGLNQTEFSFTKESNLIIVPIMLNGKGPYNFILDTGSETGMIFEKEILDAEVLENARTIPVQGADGNVVTELMVANNVTIEIPGLKGSQKSMLVLQENYIDIKSVIGIDAHGILGSEIFNRFTVEIDYDKELVRVSKPSKFTAPKGFKKFDISIEDFRPFIKVKVKQGRKDIVDVKLLMDTGASSALFLDAKNNENISLPEKNVDHTLGKGLAGTIEGKVGRVKKLWIGKFCFRRVLTSYPENWALSNVKDDIEEKDIRYGTIGADLMSRFHVIFDYRNKAVYLKKGNTYSDNFDFNSVGINILASGPEFTTYVISDVMKGSPAEKVDLRVGDELIAINGSPAFFKTVTDINTRFQGKSGTILTLLIRRGKILLSKQVRLKRIL